MSDASKNPQKKGKGAQAAGGKNQPVARRPSQRTLSKKRREERRQRLVMTVVGVAVGLAVLTLIIGVSYDQLWTPSRPVARVGSTTLTRQDYWQERRYALAQEVVQNVQLQVLFGDNPQFGGQLSERNPAVNLQAGGIRDTDINEQTVNAWIEEQVIQSGAAEMGIEVSTTDVNQQIVQELGPIFLPEPAAPVTATETLTGTAEVTGTVASDTTAEVAADEDATPEATETATATVTPSPTVTPGGPTLTPTITDTPAPTDTPRPTPEPDVANEQAPEVIDALYSRFETEIQLLEQEVNLSREDFAQGMEEQYRQQLLIERVQAELLSADSFTPTDERQRVRARQILLAVDAPEDATEEEIDLLYDEQRDEAEEVVEELRAGADFAELAAEVSDDPGSREAGGDLGFFDAEGVTESGAVYLPELVETAFDLEEGAISEPIRTQFGWHIVEVTEVEIPDEEQQLSEARAEAFETWLEEQRTDLTIERFPAPTPTTEATTMPTPEPEYLPGPPTAVPTPTLEPTLEPTPEIIEDTDDGFGPTLPTETPPADEDEDAATPAADEAETDEADVDEATPTETPEVEADADADEVTPTATTAADAEEPTP
jgi:hypothetical protein